MACVFACFLSELEPVTRNTATTATTRIATPAPPISTQFAALRLRGGGGVWPVGGGGTKAGNVPLAVGGPETFGNVPVAVGGPATVENSEGSVGGWATDGKVPLAVGGPDTRGSACPFVAGSGSSG